MGSSNYFFSHSANLSSWEMKLNLQKNLGISTARNALKLEQLFVLKKNSTDLMK